MGRALRLPRRFGPYLLLARLGEGGNGTVHLAKPLNPHRGIPTPIVIKRLNREPSKDAQMIRRFEHEAEIAVSVDSPYVVKVYDVGAVDRQPYIAMEYIQGCMLSRVLQALLDARRFAPIPAAVELVIGGLRGLAALHDAADPRTGEPLGAVHRDVSPRNLMLDERGDLRLIDLGLGKSNIQDWKTRTGLVMGSPGYMAPEQARGEGIDHRADLYAIATVLYELLVLEPYIQRGDRIQMLRAMEHPRYVPMGERRANVPAPLEEVVRQGLAIDPRDRFPTARAFIDALEHAVPTRGPQPFGRILRELVGRELDTMRAHVVRLIEEETIPPEEEDDSISVIYAVRSGVHTLDDREPSTLIDGEPVEETPVLEVMRSSGGSTPTIALPPVSPIQVRTRRGIPIGAVIMLIAVAIGSTLALDRFVLRPNVPVPAARAPPPPVRE